MEEGGWERRRGLLLGAFFFLLFFFFGMDFWEGLEDFVNFFQSLFGRFWWILGILMFVVVVVVVCSVLPFLFDFKIRAM